MSKHPSQKVHIDKSNVKRFVSNKICKWIIDSGRVNMNELATMPFDDEDRAQFAQLIGYSVSGWGDLSYVTPSQIAAADRRKVV